ncbi:DNA transposase THAP9 [Holothuria leucospilota]|uniref:DNA transposase THAP9 n=1 Tax=Holothuria leucospilota TaxID=206669 RepID=A0A9Q1HJF6_HOLLE|nr:DNA transposase THAP9 [Holothuria leucospilota]
MFDAMALKKEVVYDPKNGNNGGFVDCGNILPSDSDSLATEALVFMAVGLTSNWKFPVAYYLVDHLPSAIQAEILRQLISILTEAGLVVHGVVCDGSYANQNTSSLLGCSVTPTGLKHFFPHPINPNEKALSSSVADAIDFLRDDLHLPQFSGSEKTTEFIRIVDKLFDFMNSRSPHAKGYNQPMRLTNLTGRKKWLMETKEYLGELKDATGQSLTKCRRKTAWVGFMMTIESVTEICHNLLTNSQPAHYVCTFKMSQDHLESFFSRIRRRGGWNNNPNCLQFKWALRAILQKNSACHPRVLTSLLMSQRMPCLFKENQPLFVMSMKANLLHKPSEFHDHILHYIAGYVSKHVMEHCKCTKCCIALHNQNAHDGVNDHSYCADGTHACFTKRKDRGGLRKARDDVFKIVKTTDNVFRWVPLGITYQYFNSKLFHSFLVFAYTAEPYM